MISLAAGVGVQFGSGRHRGELLIGSSGVVNRVCRTDVGDQLGDGASRQILTLLSRAETPRSGPGGFFGSRKAAGMVWGRLGLPSTRRHFPRMPQVGIAICCRSEAVHTGSMSCVDITPEMARLLAALRSSPVSPEVLAQVRAMPEWVGARFVGLGHGIR